LLSLLSRISEYVCNFSTTLAWSSILDEAEKFDGVVADSTWTTSRCFFQRRRTLLLGRL